MIYHFVIRKDKKKTRKKELDFWLSADSEKELYRRAANQYEVDLNDIDIIEAKSDKEVKI